MQRASCALYGRGYGKWNFEGSLKVLDARFVAIPERLAFSLPFSLLHGQRGRCPSHLFTLTLRGGATGISWGSFDKRCRKCWPRLELCGGSGGLSDCTEPQLSGIYDKISGMKRVFLFVAVNLAVMFLLMLAVNVILSLAGPDVRESMYHGGIDMFSLGVFSLVFGMGGAFISLLISKPMAKWSVGAQVIDGSEGERERWLVATVERLARSANIKMPEVAIYRGAPNAFATGAFKNSALVAVSDQIMAQMDRSELEAVLAHEVSHVVNGDMVTLTLVQGVLNAVVLFLSRMIAYVVDNAMGEKNRRGSSGMYFIVMYAMQILLGILASLIVCAYSRRREYAADAGSARLLGTPQPMINALRRLGGDETALPQSLRAFGIGGKSSTSIWATHPSIEDRVAALERIRVGI